MRGGRDAVPADTPPIARRERVRRGGFMVDDAFAEPLAPTPQCHDGDAPTVRQSEGPYFKPSSPERADLVEPNSKARLVEVRGQVLTRSCRPVPRSEEHTSELQSHVNLVCRLLLEKKKLVNEIGFVPKEQTHSTAG